MKLNNKNNQKIIMVLILVLIVLIVYFSIKLFTTSVYERAALFSTLLKSGSNRGNGAANISVNANGATVEYMTGGLQNENMNIKETIWYSRATPEQIQAAANETGDVDAITRTFFPQKCLGELCAFVDTANASSTDIADAMNRIVTNVYAVPMDHVRRWYENVNQQINRRMQESNIPAVSAFKITNGRLNMFSMSAMDYQPVNNTNFPLSYIALMTAVASRLDEDLPRPNFVNVEPSASQLGEVRNTYLTTFLTK